MKETCWGACVPLLLKHRLHAVTLYLTYTPYSWPSVPSRNYLGMSSAPRTAPKVEIVLQFRSMCPYLFRIIMIQTHSAFPTENSF